MLYECRAAKGEPPPRGDVQSGMFRFRRHHIPIVAGFLVSAVFVMTLDRGALDWIPNWILLIVGLVGGGLWGYWIFTHEELSPNHKGLVFFLATIVCILYLAHYVPDTITPRVALPSYPPAEPDRPTPRNVRAIEPSATKESRPFAVDIEHRIITLPGPYGTSFWFGSFFGSACSLEPTGAAIFLRITNRQKHKEMITAYSLSGLKKIQVPHGRMFVILSKGQLGSGFVPHTIDFGAPAGVGMFVRFPVDAADVSKAIPVTGDFLDYKIGEGHYLDADEPVRGWVFFEYRKGYVQVPAHLTVNITDQFQHTFSYLIPDHEGDPQGDILPRRVVEGPLEDLSRCAIHK